MDDNQFWIQLLTLIIVNLGAIVAAWKSLTNRIGENTQLTKENKVITEQTSKRVDDTIVIAKVEAVKASTEALAAKRVATDAKEIAAVTAKEHKEEIKELKEAVNGRLDMLIAEAKKAAFFEGKKEGWLARDRGEPLAKTDPPT